MADDWVDANAAQLAYPDAQEALAEARKYETDYGTPAHGYISRNSVMQTPTLAEAKSFINEDQPFNLARTITSEDQAAQIAQGLKATRRSAVGTLGFDPSRIAMSPNSQRIRVNMAGAYDPTMDQIWVDMQRDYAIPHESMHRGLEKLRQAGLYPSNLPDEEYLVRALMQRYFGNVEGGHENSDKQIAEARRVVNPGMLDQLERIAGDYRAKQSPRGPR